MATYGQPAKAGKARRDTPSDGVRARRTIAQRIRLVDVPFRDAEPIGTALAASLGMAFLTQSPMSSGTSGHITQNTGAGIIGRDARRTEALQEWRGAGAPVAKDKRRAKVGVQAGPASMPAFPSTGLAATPSLVNVLTGLDTPYGFRNPGVST